MSYISVSVKFKPDNGLKGTVSTLATPWFGVAGSTGALTSTATGGVMTGLWMRRAQHAGCRRV